MHRLIITFLLLAFHVIAYPAPLIASNNYIIQPGELAKLSAKAAREGIVPIIIGLKLPPPGFRPEGYLSPGEVKQQRDAITTAREGLLSSLSGYEIEVYRVYASIPYVAMKVDADALKELVRSPYVQSIEEDSLERTHGNDSSEALKRLAAGASGSVEAD
jgi:hypothetical protein